LAEASFIWDIIKNGNTLVNRSKEIANAGHRIILLLWLLWWYFVVLIVWL